MLTIFSLFFSVLGANAPPKTCHTGGETATESRLGSENLPPVEVINDLADIFFSYAVHCLVSDSLYAYLFFGLFVVLI